MHDIISGINAYKKTVQSQTKSRNKLFSNMCFDETPLSWYEEYGVKTCFTSKWLYKVHGY